LLLLATALLEAAEPQYHVLEKGETLYSVARSYNIPLAAVLSANGISDPGKVAAGKRLLIPRMHKVAKGETLFGIARDYGIKIEELYAANKLSEKSLIKQGDSLFIPGSMLGSAVQGKPSASSAPGTAIGTSPGSAVVQNGTPGKATSKPAVSGAASTGSAPSTPSAVKPNGTPKELPPSLMPAPVKTSAKAVDTSISWPCSGEAVYLDGKLFGVMIRAAEGSRSKAVASGTVVSAGPYRGFGQVAFVQSKGGHIYVYGGNERLGVEVGQTIKSGQELGRIGYDQKEKESVAYFFVFRDGEALDPARAPRD